MLYNPPTDSDKVYKGSYYCSKLVKDQLSSDVPCDDRKDTNLMHLKTIL